MIAPVLSPGFLAQTCPDCNGRGQITTGVGGPLWPPLPCDTCEAAGKVIREDIVAVALGDIINLVRDEIANAPIDYKSAHQTALRQFMGRLTREYGVQA